MIEIIFDTTKNDLEILMSPWKAEALRYVWSNEGNIVTITDLYGHLYTLHNISRASITQFMKKMIEAGIIENTPQTGKGGIHGRFSSKLDEETFKEEVTRTVLNKLLEFSPEGMRQFMVERA